MGIITPNVPQGGMGDAGDKLAAGIDKIGNIFQDRYNKKEYDDWLAGPAKDYQDQMRAAQDLLLDNSNPDAAQQAVFAIKDATTKYMDNATRYASNPYIQSQAQRIWNGNLAFMKGNFVDPLKAAQANKANAEAANLKAQTPGIPAAQEAATNLKNAQAGQANRSPVAGKDALKGIIPLLSGDPAQLSSITDPDQKAAAARTNVISAINSPKDAQQAKMVKEGIDNEARGIALQQVSARAARQEVRPSWKDENGNVHGGDVWNPGNPEHIKDAMLAIDPALPKEQFILHTLQGEGSKSGVDPSVVDKKYGAIVDPGRATPANPITRSLNDEELGKVLFGGEGWSKMQKSVAMKDSQGNDVTVQRGVSTIDEAAKNLPDSYTNLRGPIRDAIDMAIPDLKKAKDDGAKITLNDIAEVVRKTANQRVVGPLLGGEDRETKDLPEGLRRNRMAAAEISKAAAKKYAAEIADQLGIEIKKAPKATAPVSKGIGSNTWLKNTPLGALGSDYDAITGLLKGNK